MRADECIPRVEQECPTDRTTNRRVVAGSVKAGRAGRLIETQNSQRAARGDDVALTSHWCCDTICSTGSSDLVTIGGEMGGLGERAPRAG